VIATVYVAGIQYRASHAPVLCVIKVNYKISVKEDSFYKVIVKNRGNGMCLDAFLLVKEIKKGKIKSEYFLSKPTREISPGCEQIFKIPKNNGVLEVQEVKYLVVYRDFFGREYLASDALKGELRQNQSRDNKHMERFAKKAQLLSIWSLIRYRYRYWKRKAIKQKNTALYNSEKAEKIEKQRSSSLFEELFKEKK